MTTTHQHAEAQRAVGIDPRAPQLNAAITAVVLVAVLLVPSPWAAVLTAVQAGLFALAVTRGVQHTPHAWLFRTVVRPRLAPPADLEDPAPPRFAQGVGLTFTLVAFVAYVAGVTPLAQVAVGLALVAALLNAVLGVCLGCELYLLFRRATARRAPPTAPETPNDSTKRTPKVKESI